MSTTKADVVDSTAWKAALSDWKTVSLETYKFFYESGEKRLVETIADGEKITARSYTVIGFIIPAAAISFAEILKQKGDLMYDLSIGAFVGSLFILVLLILNINVRDSWRLGTEPRHIVTDGFVHPKGLKDEEIIKALYLSEIEQLQHKILKNEKVNEKRILRFKISLYSSLGCLLVCLTCFFSRYVIL